MPDPAYVHAAFSSIAERYVTANHVLSMGTDILWRARVVEMVAEINGQVAPYKRIRITEVLRTELEKTTTRKIKRFGNNLL